MYIYILNIPVSHRIALSGSRLPPVLRLLAGIRFDVRQNLSGAPHLYADRRRWCVQGQNAARHTADIVGVRSAVARRIGGDAVGGRRSDGTSLQQSDFGDQPYRPQCGVPAAGEFHRDSESE